MKEYGDIVLAIAKPPNRGWVEARTDPIQGLLIGVGASLYYAAKHLVEHPQGLDTWDPSSLYEDFGVAISLPDHQLWWASGSLSAWSVGYFVNKAQANVAAACDVLITEWLLNRLLLPRAPLQGSATAKLCKEPVIPRLEKLIKELHVGEAAKALGLCCQSFRRLGDAARAECAVRRLATQGKAGAPASPVSLYRTQLYTDQDCLAICWGRNNAFKHRIADFREKRTGLEYTADWAITARAGLVVNSLWSFMVADVLKKS